MTCRPPDCSLTRKSHRDGSPILSRKLLVRHTISCLIGCFGIALIWPMAQRIGRSANVPVAQQFLHRADVLPVSHQVRVRLT